MRPAHVIDDLLTTEEAATLLDAKPGTLRIWRMRKKGPRVHCRIGRQVRYAKRDVLAFRASQWWRIAGGGARVSAYGARSSL